MATLPSMDEIIQEINRIKNENVEGFTTNDLMQTTGHCRNWCQEKIRSLIDSGKVEFAGRIKGTAIDGKSCQIPIYRVIKNEQNNQ